MPQGTARSHILRLFGCDSFGRDILRRHAIRAGTSCSVALCLFLFGSKALQTAIADGDTRTITMHHLHTGEDITITYKRDGRYDDDALQKLNWFLRDWRRSEATHMDPQLIDLIWEVQRETGGKPVDVVCGYRSPATNAMLRRRSRGVARFSQHMLGHAMDFYIPGVPLEHLREIGLRMQRGGVGFYPTSGSPFVHMDTGGVRMWPRMSREELLRVFPDGRTAYIPSDGRPLPGYELALADIKKHGHAASPVALASADDSGNPLAKFFSLLKPGQPPQQPDADEDADADTASTAAASGSAPHYFPSSSGPMQAAAPAQKIAAAGPPALAAPPAPAPAPAAAATAENAQNPLRAALEREAARKRELAGLYAQAPAPAAAPAPTQPASYELASYEQALVAKPPQRLAAATPNTGATRNTAAPSDNPWSGMRRDHAEDRVPPELALAYAAQPEPEAAAPTPVANITHAAVVPHGAAVHLAANAAPPPPATTIAVKRSATQSVSTIVAAPVPGAAADLRGRRFDNPWLRAVMLSPSVRRYLTPLLLGDPDYLALSALMRKPASSVMITFTADPTPGLTADRFAGSAVVFLSTVTWGARTAALR